MSDTHEVYEPKECGWAQADEGSYWDTGCGRVFVFEDGTPTENEFNYCCFCGKSLREYPYREDVES